MEISRFHFALLIFVVAYICFGIVGNYIQSVTDSIPTLQGLLYVLFLFVICLIGFVIYSLFRLQVHLSDWGFGSHRVSNWFAAIIAIIYLFKVVQRSFVLPCDWAEFSIRIIGLSMEEVIFRAISINYFLRLLSGMKYKAMGAIVASAILFIIPHVLNNNLNELFGIFVFALVLGYIYYKLHNILIPLCLHALLNTFVLGSAVVLIGFYAIVVFDKLVLSKLQNSSTSLWVGVDND